MFVGKVQCAVYVRQCRGMSLVRPRHLPPVAPIYGGNVVSSVIRASIGRANVWLVFECSRDLFVTDSHNGYLFCQWSDWRLEWFNLTPVFLSCQYTKRILF